MKPFSSLLLILAMLPASQPGMARDIINTLDGSNFGAASVSNTISKADDFTMDSLSGQLDALELELGGLPSTRVEVTLAKDNGPEGAPGDVLGTFTEFSPTFEEDSGEVDRSFALPEVPIILSAGETYWITLRATSSAAFNWKTTRSEPTGTGSTDESLFAQNSGDGWELTEPPFTTSYQKFRVCVTQPAGEYWIIMGD